MGKDGAREGWRFDDDDDQRVVYDEIDSPHSVTGIADDGKRVIDGELWFASLPARRLVRQQHGSGGTYVGKIIAHVYVMLLLY